MPKDPVPVARPALGLAALFAVARAEHRAGEEATRKGLEHYRRAGEALLKAKAQYRGEWKRLVLRSEQELGFTYMTATRYMRLARGWPQGNVNVTSGELEALWRRICGNDRAGDKGGGPVPPEWRGVHFSSATDLWETPREFFDGLHEEFGFTLDVCATPSNAKCENFFSPEEDGLKQAWRGVAFCNPPYGHDIGKWVAKARRSAREGAVVVCLLPARTDTRWWHRHVARAAEVRFLRGRLRFGGSENAAPFPSAVVVFRPGRRRPRYRYVSARDPAGPRP